MHRFLLYGLLTITGLAAPPGSIQSSQDQVLTSRFQPFLMRGCLAHRGQFPHETHCDRYYDCWDEEVKVQQCPGELMFDPIKSACEFPEKVDCGTRIRDDGPKVVSGRCLREFGTFPDPDDCQSFYECSYGDVFRKVCPFRTVFNAAALVCDHAHRVDCQGRGGIYGTFAPPIFGEVFSDVYRTAPPPPHGRPGGDIHWGAASRDSPTSKVKPSSGPDVTDSDSEGDPLMLPGSGSSSQHVTTFQCPGARGLFPYSADCSRFWLCRKYKNVLLKCPSNQLFDHISLTCGQADKVRCTLQSQS